MKFRICRAPVLFMAEVTKWGGRLSQFFNNSFKNSLTWAAVSFWVLLSDLVNTRAKGICHSPNWGNKFQIDFLWLQPAVDQDKQVDEVLSFTDIAGDHFFPAAALFDGPAGIAIAGEIDQVPVFFCRWKQRRNG